MTDVKNSRLYKTLKKAVRKEDHAELLRMLEMVPKVAWDAAPELQRFWGRKNTLTTAFRWADTPHDAGRYWAKLSYDLRKAGHDCY